jgi:hypothetical protein
MTTASEWDGYRVHFNPNGSACWLEGFPADAIPYLMDVTDKSKIQKCAASRGLVSRYMRNGNDRLNRMIRRRLGILVLESRLCGETQWG